VRVLPRVRCTCLTVRLILVRHTRPTIEPGTCYGRLDVELAPTWKADIEECLVSIPHSARVISSPSRRCLTLAEAIASRDGSPIESDARLLELDFGRWEGVAWDGIPRAELDAWAANPLDFAAGDGETMLALWSRIAHFLAELVNRGDRELVIVSHHGPIRALLAQSERRLPKTLFCDSVPWGGIRRVETRR
jgi:alpha-ribazole phosphatase